MRFVLHRRGLAETEAVRLTNSFGREMEKYRNVNGDSAVAAYEIGSDFIRIRFGNSSVYVYDAVAPGVHHVEQMKALAIAGRGLGTYISQNVRKNYARKE